MTIPKPHGVPVSTEEFEHLLRCRDAVAWLERRGHTQSLEFAWDGVNDGESLTDAIQRFRASD